MKKTLAIFLLFFPSAAFADMTSTITSSVKVEGMSAATAADRVGNSYSVSGTGVNTTDGTTAGTWAVLVLPPTALMLTPPLRQVS